MRWKEIHQCLNVPPQADSINLNITELLTDSRVLRNAPKALFFAIKGNQDGHHFIGELYEKGVRHFITEDPVDTSDLPYAKTIQVTSSIQALQKIAHRHRQEHSLTTVAITGSNGKTTVKEWLASLLLSQFNVVKTPKSFNSQIGVPLSLWNIKKEHEVGIFEAGISQRGEMLALANIILPDVGIFTNIGPAHADGFDSIEEKINEKARLFEQCETIICCADHENILEVLKQQYPGRLLSWTFDKRKTDSLLISKSSRELSLIWNNEQLKFSVPFDFDIWIENAVHAIIGALHLGVKPKSIATNLKNLRPVQMRLTIKKGLGNSYLIDDTYNNDLHGLEVALNYLDRQKQKEKKSIILSDLIGSDLSNQELYNAVGKVVSSYSLDSIYLVGENISQYSGCFAPDAHTFPDTPSFLANPPDIKDHVTLLKGARKFQFEKIVRHYEEKKHQTQLEVNFEFVAHNLSEYRSRILKEVKIMGMVKAFGYGGGAIEIANFLQFHNIDYLGVAYTDEAISLRRHGVQVPIMVMSPQSEHLGLLAQYDIEPEVYKMSLLTELVRLDAPPAVHIKIETGMNRLGFVENEWQELASLLKSHSNIKVAGVFTHLSSADDPSALAFSQKQIDRFEKAYQLISEKIGYQPLRHVVNSAGIVQYPNWHFDMVRLGIGLYGYDPTGKLELKEVSRLTSYISQIKSIRKGEYIGYGRLGMAQKNTRIAIVPIGYADGFDRRHGNGISHMVWHGKYLPTIGNICMDMTMLEINDLPVQEGDAVEVFGNEQSISTLAQNIGTIPYEMLTSVGQRVARVFHSE